MMKQSGCIENCIYCVSVSVMNKTGADHNHSECIGLYTELIRWHCLGAESSFVWIMKYTCTCVELQPNEEKK